MIVKSGHQKIFNPTPRALNGLTLDIGGNRVMAYFDEGFTGPVMVIAGNQLIGTMKDITESLKLAEHAISPKGGHANVELIPAESIQDYDCMTFDEWLKSQS